MIPEETTIWTELKRWTHTNTRKSSSLCSNCQKINPRKAPPARGTSQTIAALGLAEHTNAVEALREVQHRWEDIAARTTADQIEEFSDQHRATASHAEQDLNRMHMFWAERHATHMSSLSTELMHSGRRGPLDCRLCKEYAQSLVEPQYQLDHPNEHQPDRPNEYELDRANEPEIDQEELYGPMIFPPRSRTPDTDVYEMYEIVPFEESRTSLDSNAIEGPGRAQDSFDTPNMSPTKEGYAGPPSRRGQTVGENEEQPSTVICRYVSSPPDPNNLPDIPKELRDRLASRYLEPSSMPEVRDCLAPSPTRISAAAARALSKLAAISEEGLVSEEPTTDRESLPYVSPMRDLISSGQPHWGQGVQGRESPATVQVGRDIGADANKSELVPPSDNSGEGLHGLEVNPTGAPLPEVAAEEIQQLADLAIAPLRREDAMTGSAGGPSLHAMLAEPNPGMNITVHHNNQDDCDHEESPADSALQLWQPSPVTPTDQRLTQGENPASQLWQTSCPEMPTRRKLAQATSHFIVHPAIRRPNLPLTALDTSPAGGTLWQPSSADPRCTEVEQAESPASQLWQPSLVTPTNRGLAQAENLAPQLWQSFLVASRKQGSAQAENLPTQLWQQPLPKTPTRRELAQAANSYFVAHPGTRRPNLPLTMPDPLPAGNTLWQPTPRPPSPRLDPESLLGRAAIQRIRNYLEYPDATPLQILSIRSLPDTLIDPSDLMGFAKDVLSVAWRQEDEDASKIIRAGKIDPESFDGKHTLQRIKRALELPDDATATDILSVAVLPDSLDAPEELEAFAADIRSIAWKEEDELEARRRLMAAVDPASIPLPRSPPPRPYRPDQIDPDSPLGLEMLTSIRTFLSLPPTASRAQIIMAGNHRMECAIYRSSFETGLKPPLHRLALSQEAIQRRKDFRKNMALIAWKPEDYHNPGTSSTEEKSVFEEEDGVTEEEDASFWRPVSNLRNETVIDETESNEWAIIDDEDEDEDEDGENE